MHILVIVLLVVGVLGIYLEFMMPGWDSYIVFGLGIMALAAAALITVLSSNVNSFLVIGVVAVLVIGGGFTMFKLMRRKQNTSGLMLNDVDEAPQEDVSGFLGKEGKAVTMLRPAGEVDFNGVRKLASSDGPFIEVGQKVRVIHTHANKILVKAIEGN